MGEAYLPIFIALAIAVVFSIVFVLLSRYFGPERPNAQKESVYECGMPPIGNAHQRFSVKFYLVAVLFILFDLEAVFIYPWSVVFRDFVTSGIGGAGIYIFGEMALFLTVLFLGWVYVIKRGAIDWNR